MAPSDDLVSNEVPISALSLEPVQTTIPASCQRYVDTIRSKFRGGNADNISFSQTEAEELIRLLSATKAVATSAPNLLEQEIVKEDLKTLKAYVRLGDYAGYVFNCLKKTTLGGDLEKHANVLSERLEGRNSAARASDTVVRSFKKSVDELSSIDSRINDGTAFFAIQAYGRRNEACHSESLQRMADRDWSGLADQIETDLSELTTLLPDDQMHHHDNWIRVIEFFRDQKLSKDPSTGQWGPKQVQPVPEEDPQANDEDVLFVDDKADIPRQANEPTAPFSAELPASAFDNLPPARRRDGWRSDPVPGVPQKRKSSFSDDVPANKRLRRGERLKEVTGGDSDKNKDEDEDSDIQALLQDFKRLRQRFPDKYPEVRDNLREEIAKKFKSLENKEAKANTKAAKASRRGKTAV